MKEKIQNERVEIKTRIKENAGCARQDIMEY